MIRLNLLPLKETERALGRRQQLSLIALGVSIALLIMIIPFLIQGRTLASLDAQIDELNREVQQYNTQVREVHELDHLKKEVQAKLNVIEDLNRKRVGPSRVLDDLSGATPENLWLIDFTENVGQATLTGLALDNETIARFMRQLQASPYFFAVDLVETSRTTPQTPAKPVPGTEPLPSFTHFSIKASIDYFGRHGKPPEPPPDAKPTTATGAPAHPEPKA
jgi:type IV pilus assembly protein PilN